ncbi:MAG: cation-translocating P-type ATPase [Rhodospirillales bacterium]|nr:cation-translocating P-type ATPase [Rhodospirillales bacterium]
MAAPTEADQPACAWHAMTAEDVAARLEMAPERGLGGDEARRRLAEQGPNRLAEAAPRAAWRKLLDQFKSVLILILAVAAGVAFVFGDLTDTVVILVVVVFNAMLGFYQERRAEQSLNALKKMLALKARVRRDGAKQEIDAADLVPGDLVLLQAGDKTPADGRLIAARELQVDEAALTGESEPAAKSVAPVSDGTPLAERGNMVFMNTVVTRGRGEMIVTATGSTTEMGRIAGMMRDAPQELTPLQRQLDRLGKRLAIVTGAVIALIFLLSLFQGSPFAAAALTAITLAVAAIPEGLPAVVTLTLALGMRRMAARQAIVKRLAAVETLGCTTVICSDKTGTLTLNQMTARALWSGGRRYAVDGEGYGGDGRFVAHGGGENDGGAGEIDGAPDGSLRLLVPAAVCNDSRVDDGRLIGDPTEGALVALTAKAGVDVDEIRRRLPRVAEIPFDSAKKYMATFHSENDRICVFVKGASEVLLGKCATLADGTGEAPLDAGARSGLNRELEVMAESGLRVLAVASREIPASAFDANGPLEQHVADLCLQGLIGIKDPARAEARDAIGLCREAGIEVKMITGDHRATAAAIAAELALEGEVVTAAEVDAMGEAELAERIPAIAVFARVAPEHKVKLVRALKRAGHVVAMTGDGVNDAPALKNADIGVAMGVTGTEVSKEAAAMILTDDNFATIVRAVEEGRTIYANIVKFVRFQLATNIGALATVLAAVLLGWPVPFNPIQILWVNIIMDGPPAMALGVDPARPGAMAEPPRAPGAEILSLRRLSVLAFLAAIMTAGTLGVFYYGRATGDEVRATTLAFTTFVAFQFFNVFNARAETDTAFSRQFFANRPLWLALLGVVVLQVVAVHWPPAQAVFRTTALTLSEWALALAVGSSVLLIEEARKLALRLFRPAGARFGTIAHG